MIKQHVELAAEQLRGPQPLRRVGQVLRATTAKLVIEHAGAVTPLAQDRKRLQIIVRRARTTVQQHQRRGFAPRQIADDAELGAAERLDPRWLLPAGVSRRGARAPVRHGKAAVVLRGSPRFVCRRGGLDPDTVRK